MGLTLANTKSDMGLGPDGQGPNPRPAWAPWKHERVQSTATIVPICMAATEYGKF